MSTIHITPASTMTNRIATEEQERIERLIERIKDGDVTSNNLIKEMKSRVRMLGKIKEINPTVEKIND
mgnify:FL=1|tara:strand:- start:401 stop:604 length:204 start_codon:yes stop_codon:yes gene_type:complete